MKVVFILKTLIIVTLFKKIIQIKFSKIIINLITFKFLIFKTKQICIKKIKVVLLKVNENFTRISKNKYEILKINVFKN